MAMLKIIIKLKKDTRVFYFPKDNIGFCDINNYKLCITDKYNKENPFIYYFCNSVNPTDKKFDKLILEVMNKSIDTEIILDLIYNTEFRCYEPGTEVDYADDYFLRSIICSSKNNFHIYIPEHSINLK